MPPSRWFHPFLSHTDPLLRCRWNLIVWTNRRVGVIWVMTWILSIYSARWVGPDLAIFGLVRSLSDPIAFGFGVGICVLFIQPDPWICGDFPIVLWGLFFSFSAIPSLVRAFVSKVNNFPNELGWKWGMISDHIHICIHFVLDSNINWVLPDPERIHIFCWEKCWILYGLGYKYLQFTRIWNRPHPYPDPYT